MNKKKHLVFGMALVVLLAVFSFAGAQSNNPTTVTIALTDDPPSGDPHKGRGANGGHLLFNLFEGLVALNGEMDEVRPALATEWEQIDELSWRFDLRHGVKFHNGEDFNAEAVRYSVERLLDPNAIRYNDAYKPIDEVEIVDDYTVIIRNRTANPIFLAALSNLHIVPPEYTASISEEEFGRNPVGTGPYRMVEWKLGERLVLERFDDYWGPLPEIERLVYRPIPEASTRLAELQAGRVDIITSLTYDAAALLEADSALRVEASSGRRTVFLMMDLLNGAEPVQDVRVRQAMSYAIDRQLLIDAILNGYGTPMATFFRPDMFGFNSNLTPYAYDPDKAKALLTEAGYSDGFSIRFLTSDGIINKGVEVAEAVSGMLAEVGIRAEVIPVSLQTVRDMYIYNPNPSGGEVEPFWVFNFGAPIPDATDPLVNVIKSGGAESFFHDEDFDDLINAYVAEGNVDARTNMALKLQDMLYEELPVIALYLQREMYGVNERLDWRARRDEFVLGADMSLR